MLLSAGVITILYVLVALVLFGVLIVDGNKWIFSVPSRKKSFRDFFGQFSWGRLIRPTGKQELDLSPHQDTSSTAASDSAGDRGRKFSPKSIGANPATSHSHSIEDPVSGMASRLKKLAIKMLWYPTGMCRTFCFR